MPEREKNPRVLVGCPTCYLKADSLEKYFNGLNSLTYPNFDVLIEDNSPTIEYSEKIKQFAIEWEKKHPGHSFRVIYSGKTSPKARARLVNGRNKIRETMVKENYDYFLSLEQDIVPPANVIEQLLSHGKEIVSAVYFNKKTRNDGKIIIDAMVGVYGNEDERKRKIVRSAGLMYLLPSRVMEVAYVGLGCVLISKRALENISFRYNEKELACDDIYFCMDAQEKGISIYLDSSLWCAHYFNDAFKQGEY